MACHATFFSHFNFNIMQTQIEKILFPVVPVVDTSVKSMIEQGTPVAPVESQFFDQESPLHIFKSFDFKNMVKDPHALNHARSYVPQKDPAPVQSPVTPNPLQNETAAATA